MTSNFFILIWQNTLGISVYYPLLQTEKVLNYCVFRVSLPQNNFSRSVLKKVSPSSWTVKTEKGALRRVITASFLTVTMRESRETK